MKFTFECASLYIEAMQPHGVRVVVRLSVRK